MMENVEIRRLENLENRSYLEIIHGFIRNPVEMEYCPFEAEKVRSPNGLDFLWV